VSAIRPALDHFRPSLREMRTGGREWTLKEIKQTAVCFPSKFQDVCFRTAFFAISPIWFEATEKRPIEAKTIETVK
jgi:hypothetical protein